MKAKVISINISETKGVVKTPIEQGIFLEDFGLENDAHAGKWHRQVSLLALESYDKIDLPERLPIGSFAENITTEGIELHTLPVGTILQIGETIHEVTQIGKKCHTACEIRHLVGDCVMPREGIFSRVIKGGTIKADDEITIKEGDSY
jgi:MOSC domain-containing protein YiiM